MLCIKQPECTIQNYVHIKCNHPLNQSILTSKGTFEGMCPSVSHTFLDQRGRRPKVHQGSSGLCRLLVFWINAMVCFNRFCHLLQLFWFGPNLIRQLLPFCKALFNQFRPLMSHHFFWRQNHPNLSVLLIRFVSIIVVRFWSNQTPSAPFELGSLWMTSLWRDVNWLLQLD